MTQYKYLIVGGGVASLAAVQGIRERDQQGVIGICSAESNLPYDRPQLAKGLWCGDSPDSIWLKIEGQPVELMLRRKIVGIDTRGRTVVDSQKATYGFDRLLIATGSIARPLSFGGDKIIYFRTLDDYRKLRALAEERNSFGIIGGGLLGTELAIALSGMGREVSMVFPETGILGAMLPPELSQLLSDHFIQKGIHLKPGETATDLRLRAGKFAIMDQRFQEAALVDVVVSAAGVVPNTELAEKAWLTLEDGIQVDEYLRTSCPTIFAAGDVAQFRCPALGKRIRVTHQEHAKAMGRQAGRNMAGERKRYETIPAYSGALLGLSFEAVGDVDARYQTCADWNEPLSRGIVYYLDQNRVRGVLFWNVRGDVEMARKLIAQTAPVKPEELKGRISSEV
jgi:NAD(P)H-nitrite reductase large subunit